MRTESIVSSKGQVTLAAAMRAKLGIQAGSRIGFEVRGNELVIKSELPMSSFCGMLKDFDLGDTEPPTEADRGLNECGGLFGMDRVFQSRHDRPDFQNHHRRPQPLAGAHRIA
jgi:AbrB family looped-hinge helix DNA binding protein